MIIKAESYYEIESLSGTMIPQDIKSHFTEKVNEALPVILSIWMADDSPKRKSEYQFRKLSTEEIYERIRTAK